jgi:uncharacterized OB-fold protein
MGIEAYICAALSALESQRAWDVARKQRESGLTYQDPILKMRRESVTPGKCTSCGSRQFQHHNAVLICSYCRSPK